MKKYPVSRQVIEDLAKVEAAINEVVDVPGERLSDLVAGTLAAGGKRLRPVLVLISGQVGGYDLARLTPAAVAVELVHTASLIHDDVLDEAKTRRGQVTIFALKGERTALSAGDFLFSKAFEVLSDLSDLKALKVLSEAAVALCIGEFEQMETAHKPEQTIDIYLEKVGHKTAALFGACCKLGALVAGAPDEDADRLEKFGYDLGIAFQIYDDILDLSGGTELGKPIGSDLRGGTVTLPMLLALEEVGDGKPLREVIEGRLSTDKDVTNAINFIRDTSAIERSLLRAKKYVDEAIRSARLLENSSVAQQLAAIGEFVIDRYH